MKRKIFIITALIVCMSFALSSCALLTLNEERRSANIAAAVSYTAGNGYVAKRSITRLRLIQTVNQVVNQYYNSYGSLPEGFDIAEEVENVLDQLCDYQLVVLYAIDYLSQAKAGVLDENGKWNGDTNYKFIDTVVKDREFYGDAEAAIASADHKDGGAVLTYAEFDKVIKNANAQYESIFERHLEAAETRQKAREDAAAEDTEEEDDDAGEAKTLTPRKVKIAAAEEEFDYKANQKVKDGGLTKYYPKDYLNFTGISEAKANKDTQDEKNRRDAWAATESELKRAYVDYKYLFDQALDSMVIFEYKRMLTSYNDVTEEEIEAYIEKIVNQNKESYKTLDDYRTAINSSYQNIYYHKNAGDNFYVKNLVISFDAVTKAAVDKLIKENYKDVSEAEKDPEFIKTLTKLAKNASVNVSNIFYDPDDGTELFYTAEKFAEIFGLSDGEKTEIEAQIEGLKEWVNDKDTTNGDIKEYIEEHKDDHRIIFILSAALDTSKAYLVEGLSSEVFFEIYTEYMSEAEKLKDSKPAAEQAKTLIEAFDAWFYAVNDDGETTFNAAQDYLVYENHKQWSSVFTEHGVSLFGENGAGGIKNGVGNYYYKDGEDKVYAAVSNFGYHILMITYVPFDKNVDTLLPAGEDGKSDGILSLDHIFDYINVKTGEDGLPTNDLRFIVKTTLKTEKDNDLYFVEQRKILTMKDTDGSRDRVKYEKFEKAYKDLKKTK
ncbi:MAG: hypothetical protein LBP62_00660 [Clostridiales bacterium]|jgi:hypothetical protein|nr:hypothetical protein [Clostridiales bacterium]